MKVTEKLIPLSDNYYDAAFKYTVSLESGYGIHTLKGIQAILTTRIDTQDESIYRKGFLNNPVYILKQSLYQSRGTLDYENALAFLELYRRNYTILHRKEVQGHEEQLTHLLLVELKYLKENIDANDFVSSAFFNWDTMVGDAKRSTRNSRYFIYQVESFLKEGGNL